MTNAKELETSLIAKAESSPLILMSNLPIARTVIRMMVPVFMGILRRELDQQRRELTTKGTVYAGTK